MFRESATIEGRISRSAAASFERAFDYWRAHPLCEECGFAPSTRVAYVASDGRREALCARCHSVIFRRKG
jgi:hypothetical protein